MFRGLIIGFGVMSINSAFNAEEGELMVESISDIMLNNIKCFDLYGYAPIQLTP